MVEETALQFERLVKTLDELLHDDVDAALDLFVFVFILEGLRLDPLTLTLFLFGLRSVSVIANFFINLLRSDYFMKFLEDWPHATSLPVEDHGAFVLSQFGGASLGHTNVADQGLNQAISDNWQTIFHH